MATTLNLRIHTVKCVDETGGSWAEKFGNDEIYLGGFSIDTKAKVSKLNPFSVYSEFDDGDSKKYNPPRIFASYQLPRNFTVPLKCFAGFLLIEKDSGGMDTATLKVYNEVKKEIDKKKEELEDRVDDIVPVTIGSIPISIIWAAIKPYIYGYVKDKVAGWFGDEIFPLQDVSTTITGPDHTWHGKKNSPVSMVEFRGHGGIYQLFYDWELR